MPTPDDIVVLRRTDPGAASAWRLRLREELGAPLTQGGTVVGFTRTGDYLVLASRSRDSTSSLASVAAMAHPFSPPSGSTQRGRSANGTSPTPRRSRLRCGSTSSSTTARSATEPINSYVDTTSGELVMELGQLDDPDVTVTTDYETAKSLFLASDPATGMQAFMAGKLVVQGDMMKLVIAPRRWPPPTPRPGRLGGDRR